MDMTPTITREGTAYRVSDPLNPAMDLLVGTLPPIPRSPIALGAWLGWSAPAWGKPVLVRIMHEMTGRWYDWAGGPGNTQGNTPESCIAAWRHVSRLFSIQAPNVQLVWCPSVIMPGIGDLRDFYPGTAYVDYLGLDGYNWGSPSSNPMWSSFAQIFQESYAQLTSLGPQPVIICEIGCSELGGNKAQWIADLAVSAPTLARLAGLCWFNRAASGGDWRVESSAESLAAFQQLAALPVFGGRL